MSYASKFMSVKSTDAPAAPVFGNSSTAFSGGRDSSSAFSGGRDSSSAFSGGRDQPQTNSSLFGNRRPAVRPTANISEAAIAANPWAARAAAANGIKIEEKLNLESEKQFPSLSVGTQAPKKGAWGNSTVTAAALAADWAAKEAEENAAAAAEKQRREDEAAHLAEQRRQYSTFTPTSRSDVFRREVYENSYDDEYDDQPDDTYEDRTYEVEEQEQEKEQEWQQQNTW
jgi:hypothetical protein